jgi:hypothetical protein
MGHPARAGKTTEPYGQLSSTLSENIQRCWTEVSRGHSSQTLIAMGEKRHSLLLRSSSAELHR